MSKSKSELEYDKDSLFAKMFKVRHPQGVKEFKKRVERGDTLTDIAAEFNFSRAYASVVFQKLFNQKYVDFKNEQILTKSET